VVDATVITDGDAGVGVRTSIPLARRGGVSRDVPDQPCGPGPVPSISRVGTSKECGMDHDVAFYRDLVDNMSDGVYFVDRHPAGSPTGAEGRSG
jgi:hypothetical protein